MRTTTGRGGPITFARGIALSAALSTAMSMAARAQSSSSLPSADASRDVGGYVSRYEASMGWEVSSESQLQIDTVVENPLRSGQTDHEHDDVDFVRDHDSLAFTVASEYRRQRVAQPHFEKKRIIIQGGRMLSLDTIDPRRAASIVAKFASPAARMSELLTYVGASDGYLLGNGSQSLADLLRHATLTPHAAMETVDNTACVAFDAVSPEGKLTLWLAPSQGYALRRLVIAKGPADLFQDQPLTAQRLSRSPGDESVSFVLRLDNTDVRKVENFFIPFSSKVVYVATLGSGRSQTTTKTYSRSKIDLHPDFAAMHAFDLRAADGTRVVDIEHQNTGVQYEWRGGAVVTAVNDADEARIQKLLNGSAGNP